MNNQPRRQLSRLSFKSQALRAFIVAAYLVAASIFLSSCLTKKRLDRICKLCTLKETRTERDSVGEPMVKRSLYDSVVEIKNRDGRTFIYANCDSLMAALNRSSDSTISETKNGVKGTISGKGGKLVIKCETDALKDTIRMLREEINTPHYKYIETVKEVPARCELEHTTWWHRFQIWCGRIFLVCVLITAGWILIKARTH